jgi:glyoxylase-like metal-dependent hydrolase (beta-lactamase superfamily II)
MPGHTPYQVVVYIPEEKIAFTSDNIFCKVQTWLRQALPYELLDSLKRIEELDTDVLVPGHGEVCNKSYIPEMRSLVKDWIDSVTAAIEQGLSLEDAQEKITFRDPYLVEGGGEEWTREVHRMNVARLYEVLKK